MTSAAAPPARALIESDRVEGTAVYDRDGHHIGAVERLMVDKVGRQVAYVVVAFAYPGLADASHTTPWGKLRYDTDLGGYRTDIAEGGLHAAPRLARGGEEDDRLGQDQEEELHAYFRIPPYWRAM